MRNDRAPRGFTLIEVLVAFVIASLAFAVLAHAGLEGLRSANLSGRYQEALTRARSHLAAIGDNPQPSDRQGDEGEGYHWHVRILRLADAPLAAPDSAGGLASGGRKQVTLLAVEVQISWGEGRRRSVQLQTERVAVASARP